IKMMQEELLKNNVDIKKQTKINKIIIENKQVLGVEINGKLIKAMAVLSNANLMTTIEKMIGENHFNSKYIDMAKKVRLNSSSCQVYIGIKPGETIPFIGDLIFTSSFPTFNTTALLSKDISSRTFSVYYPQGRPYDAQKRYAIVSSTNANWADWSNLSDHEYKSEKEKMIQETITSLTNLVPDIADKIDYIDAATPVTIQKYTHHQQGSSFGTKFEGLEVSMKMHKEIKGMFHAGSVGIIMSGWLGAANYGVIQANEVQSYLFGQENK
ncbi:MAG: phytoene dehydrogenase, partial [Halobacteriovoraceae bacterium]|nr:phytoene dehydrogenase [Halobacteriovoraceae bacterium]